MSQEGSITVFVPGPLREYCGGAARLALAARSVREAMETLARDWPALHRGVRDETGAVRRHVNIFVNEDNIRDLAGLDTAVSAGDTIIILPAVSGG